MELKDHGGCISLAVGRRSIDESLFVRRKSKWGPRD